MLGGSLLVAAGVIAVGLTQSQLLPVYLIPGKGLTDAKVRTEYLIIALNVLAACVFLMRMRQKQPYPVVLLFLAAAIMALSEVFFTLYAATTDQFIHFAHLYKVIAYWVVYRAVFVEGIRFPFEQLRKSEAAAAEQRIRLHGVVSLAMDAIISIDDRQDVVLFNTAAERIFGYSADEVIGRPLALLLPARFRSGYLDHVRRFGAQGGTRSMGARQEIYGLRRDGTEFPIEASISTAVSDARPIHTVTLRDITERKATATALQESEARFRGLTDLFANYSWEVDAEFRFTRIEGGRAEIYGLRPDTVLGRSTTELQMKTELVSPSREAFDALREQHLPYNDVVTRIELADGTWRYLSAWGEPRFSADGQFLGYRGVTRDVTERVLIELQNRATNERLEQRVEERTRDLEERTRDLEERTRDFDQASRELESFSYSVAHDLRAPLRAIGGFSKVVRENFDRDNREQSGKYLLRVEQNVAHMSRLIDNLLVLSRTSSVVLVRATVDMQALVDGVVHEMSGDPAVRAAFVIGEIPAAEADAALLRQVWRNLIGNAVKFSGKVPAPRVEIGYGDSRIGPAYFVRDNGAGFDMAYADKLFGIFQRLHSTMEFEGTGAGLAIVKRIVERHKGRVLAESSPGAGATIRFSLGPG